MSSVAIIGAGPIGGSIAHALATGDRVGRVLLVDATVSVARGKALDIRQSGPIARFHTHLDGTDDLSSVTGCDVCVIADRVSGEHGEWRGEEGLAMIGRIVGYLGSAPIVFAGASHASLISQAASEAHVPRRRLIGSAPHAFVSCAIAMVAMEAGCSPREVTLTVLGTPPSGWVVPWSEASIAGYPLHAVLSQAALTRVEARMAHLWPPGPYALGAAGALVTQAVLSASRQSFSVLTELDGEFGVRHRSCAVSARFSARGIAEIRVPELTTRERVQLQSALGG
jgi:malate dehydrogenase